MDCDRDVLRLVCLCKLTFFFIYLFFFLVGVVDLTIPRFSYTKHTLFQSQHPVAVAPYLNDAKSKTLSLRSSRPSAWGNQNLDL